MTSRRHVMLLGGLTLGLGPRWLLEAQARRVPPPAGPTTAFVGATVLDGVGGRLEDASVLVRGSTIVSIGTTAAAADTSIDARGLTITPGLTALLSPMGLAEIDLEASTRDASHEEDADPVRASFRAADGYNPRSTLLPVARLGGVTTALSTPEGGLVPGTSAWAELGGRSLDEDLLRPDVALHVNLDDAGFAAAHGARPAALGRLRELFDDARYFARNRAAFDRGEMRDTSVSRLDLERIVDVIEGRLPLVVRVARADDIARAITFASEQGARLVLAGVEEGWTVRDRIARADVPVIVEPLINLPSRFGALHTRNENAALLEEAGVRVMLMTDPASPWDAHNIRQACGNAVRFGMTPEGALAAVTSIPAAVLGDTTGGSLAAGRRATLVAWSGDPFETTTVVRHVMVGGVSMPLVSRQTLLLDRYRTLPLRPPPPVVTPPPAARTAPQTRTIRTTPR